MWASRVVPDREKQPTNSLAIPCSPSCIYCKPNSSAWRAKRNCWVIGCFYLTNRQYIALLYHLSSFIFHLSSFIFHLSSFIFTLSSLTSLKFGCAHCNSSSKLDSCSLARTFIFHLSPFIFTLPLAISRDFPILHVYDPQGQDHSHLYCHHLHLHCPFHPILHS